jgi:hypothetical protein
MSAFLRNATLPSLFVSPGFAMQSRFPPLLDLPELLAVARHSYGRSNAPAGWPAAF